MTDEDLKNADGAEPVGDGAGDGADDLGNDGADDSGKGGKQEPDDDVSYLKSKLGKQGNDLGLLRRQNELLQVRLAALEQAGGAKQTLDRDDVGGIDLDKIDVLDPKGFSQLVRSTVAEVVRGELAAVPKAFESSLDRRGLRSPVEQKLIDEHSRMTDAGVDHADFEKAVRYADAVGLDSVLDAYNDLARMGRVAAVEVGSTGGGNGSTSSGKNVDKALTGSSTAGKPVGASRTGKAPNVGAGSRDMAWAKKISSMSFADLERNGIGIKEITAAKEIILSAYQT